MLQTFSLILLMFTLNQVPADYIHYPGVNKYYKFHRDPKIWVDARDLCRAEGGSLAMPENAAEAAIMNEIFSGYPNSMLKGVSNSDYFFLNFHDLLEENEFVTDKGIPIQYYYHTWAPNQPDNYQYRENCGSLYRGGGINDFPCDSFSAFICQKSPKSNLSLSFNCPPLDPAYKYNEELNRYYKLHLKPTTWPDARAICQAEGGYLAIINSEEEEKYLVSMIPKPEERVNIAKSTDYVFIGFHDFFRENHYVTVNGDDLYSSGHVKWHPGQPDNAGGNENCGTMHISGGLNDGLCSFPLIFFCEFDANEYKQYQ